MTGQPAPAGGRVVEVTVSFRAMNTEVTAVVVVDERRRAEADAALGEVQVRFASVEATLSRFRPESELSRLNRSAGRVFPASPTLFAVVEQALAAARDTDGVFDPTILSALLAAGYDRSFELLREPGPLAPAPSVAEPSPPAEPAWRDVEVDSRARTIRLPTGRGLDLGGIGKGWTVDRAAEILRPFRDFAVDAGGDIYAAGLAADGTPWTIGVENPFEPRSNLTVLAVHERAIATSSIARRRWQKDGHPQHHLIDPRTGQPGQSGVVSATVVADSVARAEILAKVALLLGPTEGLSFLRRHPGVEGLLVLGPDRRVATPGFSRLRAGSAGR